MPSFTRFLAIAALLSSAVLAQDAGPSPTASVGCEPHGDHWHCDGPASTALSSVSSTTTETTTTDSTTASATASPTMPSPTESSGCEPHGDHWHCDGPAETSTAASSSQSTDSEDKDNGVESHKVHLLLLLGLSVAAAGFNV